MCEAGACFPSLAFLQIYTTQLLQVDVCSVEAALQRGREVLGFRQELECNIWVWMSQALCCCQTWCCLEPTGQRAQRALGAQCAPLGSGSPPVSPPIKAISLMVVPHRTLHFVLQMAIPHKQLIVHHSPSLSVSLSLSLFLHPSRYPF